MRREAATMVLAVTCSALLCTVPLLAKPTRTLTRPSARRMIIAQPMHRSSREQTLHESAAHTRPHEYTAEGRATHIHSHHQLTTASTSLRSHPHTPAEKRASAVQTASATADRSTRIAIKTQSRSAGVRHAHDLAESNRRPRLDKFNRQSTPPESAAGSREAMAGSSSAFTNVDGELRPIAGSLPLKSIEEEAAGSALMLHLRLSALYDSGGRLIIPRPLYGSREILLHQNEMADRDGLNRIQNDADLQDLRRQKKLVPLPESEALHADFRLPPDRRYTRPWTAAFLAVMATDFYATFHMPLQVDSAVRTIAVQQQLLRINGNAAPTTGDTASPHLTGQAVDIAKAGLSRTQIAWMRTYLQPLIDLGKIDVEEEFQQSCFHISVYRNYFSTAPQHLSLAAAHQSPADAIAERPSY